ncbi:MAG: hypothetical protein QMD46_13955 [Methanomicrobiales archaeon]|nr:hypothetical protein [Methanomicrobiales archaeon]MDI6877728.1 hypothetical protein [Methanomicrobiales archaeon]
MSGLVSFRDRYRPASSEAETAGVDGKAFPQIRSGLERDIDPEDGKAADVPGEYNRWRGEECEGGTIDSSSLITGVLLREGTGTFSRYSA